MGLLLKHILALFLHLHCTHLAGEAKQIDEALCIMVIVQIAGGEGSDALIVERVGRSGASLDDIALVELEFYLAGHIFLSLLDDAAV